METKPTLFSNKLILIALVLYVVLFVFFVYTVLHEAGHALVGLLFGQTLTTFNVNFWNFDAHVGMIGSLSQAQRALQSIAGAGLPLLVWFLFIALVPRKASFSVEALKLVASMAVINTLLAWIIIPILYLFGQAPSDDVTNFLRYSQLPPLLLFAGASGLYLLSWLAFLVKINGLRNQFLLFNQTGPGLIAGARTALPVMTGLMLFFAALTVMANGWADRNPANRFIPPQDFQPVAQIDLSAREYSAETLAQFTLDKADYVGVFVVIRNIDTRFFDLSIRGPNGFNKIILHGEGYRANQDGGLWEKDLPPGEYMLVLTSRQNPGTVSVYLQIPSTKRKLAP
jgi:hypothetical protein